jgi:hypothetical protein
MTSYQHMLFYAFSIGVVVAIQDVRNQWRRRAELRLLARRLYLKEGQLRHTPEELLAKHELAEAARTVTKMAEGRCSLFAHESGEVWLREVIS